MSHRRSTRDRARLDGQFVNQEAFFLQASGCLLAISEWVEVCRLRCALQGVVEPRSAVTDLIGRLVNRLAAERAESVSFSLLRHPRLVRVSSGSLPSLSICRGPGNVTSGEVPCSQVTEWLTSPTLLHSACSPFSFLCCFVCQSCVYACSSLPRMESNSVGPRAVCTRRSFVLLHQHQFVVWHSPKSTLYTCNQPRSCGDNRSPIRKNIHCCGLWRKKSCNGVADLGRRQWSFSCFFYGVWKRPCCGGSETTLTPEQLQHRASCWLRGVVQDSATYSTSTSMHITRGATGRVANPSRKKT